MDIAHEERKKYFQPRIIDSGDITLAILVLTIKVQL
jgi:hypothetical protein